MPQKTTYPLISQIKDGAVAQAYKYICDRLASIEDRMTALEAAAITADSTVDVGNKRVSSLSDAVDLTDAVTLKQLRAEVYQFKKATT